MEPVVEQQSNKTPRRAVFLDRDGTVTQLCGYVTRPEQVKLMPGAATSIRRLRTAGFQCILVTNQSAIGRGMLSAPELDNIHLQLSRLLALEGTSLDGTYFCPLQPVVPDERVIECSDRKPGPGMLLKAAADNNLTLTQS